MGEWFDFMRTRAVPKAKVYDRVEASGAAPSSEAAPME